MLWYLVWRLSAVALASSVHGRTASEISTEGTSESQVNAFGMMSAVEGLQHFFPDIAHLYHTNEQIDAHFADLSKRTCPTGKIRIEPLNHSLNLVHFGEKENKIHSSNPEDNNNNNNNNNNKQQQQQKIRVLVLFGEHARELISSEVALLMSNWLCNGRAPKLDLSRLFQDAELVIVPNTNPEGRAHVSKLGEYCWRVNGRGVDLNRNWGEHWTHTGVGETFSGPTPFSEPETSTLKSFVDGWKPQIFITVHSGEWGMYYPPAFSKDAPLSDAQPRLQSAVSAVAHKYCPYCKVGPAAQQLKYDSPGTSMDYLFAHSAKFSYVLEIYGPPGVDEHEPPAHKKLVRQKKKLARKRARNLQSAISNSNSNSNRDGPPDDNSNINDDKGQFSSLFQLQLAKFRTSLSSTSTSTSTSLTITSSSSSSSQFSEKPGRRRSHRRKQKYQQQQHQQQPQRQQQQQHNSPSLLSGTTPDAFPSPRETLIIRNLTGHRDNGDENVVNATGKLALGADKIQASNTAIGMTTTTTGNNHGNKAMKTEEKELEKCLREFNPVTAKEYHQVTTQWAGAVLALVLEALKNKSVF